MRPNIPSVTLNDGVEMHLIGFGTSSVTGDGPTSLGYDAIRTAVKCGYRFFDTAALYMNEEIVGLALNDCIRDGLVTREELFVCTKVWNTAHRRESVVRACRESLKRLNMTYVDLYLIHWPVAYAEGLDPINPKSAETGKLIYSDTHFTETWLGMEDVKEAKLARSIGLSNFNHEMIDEILQMNGLRFRPTVNQVECHPYLSQQKLLDYSRQKEIVLNAYCPLGSPGSCAEPGQPALLDDPVIKELGQKHRKTPAQILIRYQIQRRVSPIPKSITPNRIQENLDVFDFELSEEDMARLLSLDRNLRYCLNTAGEYVDDHPLYPFNVEY